ncbi:MAG: hypothetical protein ABGX27_05020 [Desulfurobacteriaceae bacterium]
MNSISVYHDKIEKIVISKLKDNGYKVVKFTYHDSINQEMTEMLKSCDSFECLFLRTLPDILAVKDNKSVFIEVKSKSPQYENLALELVPLMVNYRLEKSLGLNVIYVYGYENEQGKISLSYLHAKDIIHLVDKVFITDKFDERTNKILEKFSKDILKKRPIRRNKKHINKRKGQLENLEVQTHLS